jgi:hypothetical protein
VCKSILHAGDRLHPGLILLLRGTPSPAWYITLTMPSPSVWEEIRFVNIKWAASRPCYHTNNSGGRNPFLPLLHFDKTILLTVQPATLTHLLIHSLFWLLAHHNTTTYPLTPSLSHGREAVLRVLCSGGGAAAPLPPRAAPTAPLPHSLHY